VHKYATLDDELLAAIRGKSCSFKELQAKPNIIGLADELAPKNSLGGEMGWRLIDRRLQVLRKSGKIESYAGYWRIARKAG
jgi:hypothetical protein